MFEVENAASKAELGRNRQESLLKDLENDIAVLLEEKRELELAGREKGKYDVRES